MNAPKNADYTLWLKGEHYQVRFKDGDRRVNLSLEEYSRARGGLATGDAHTIAQRLANDARDLGVVAAIDDLNELTRSAQTAQRPAEYAGYARQVVARAGAEHQVDPKAAALVFTDVSLDGQIDSVDVGAPRQVPERIRAALDTVRKDIAAMVDGWAGEAGIFTESFKSKERDSALAALDEIETALSGQSLASFKWEPVQDLSLPEREPPASTLPFVRPDDVEDENLIAQGGGWMTFKRKGVWWAELERNNERGVGARVSFSMHTTDDAVAGARFYKFQEEHRSTAIQFLLSTTVAERSSWVKR